MVSAAPPKGIGRMARREMRLAYTMLLPTFLIVLAIVLWPLLANFWISAKPVQLGDLRPATLVANERLRGNLEAPGDTGTLEFRLRNSSRDSQITNAAFSDTLPAGLDIGDLDQRCSLTGRQLTCELGDLPGAFRDWIRIPVTATEQYFEASENPRDSKPITSGTAERISSSLPRTFAVSSSRRNSGMCCGCRSTTPSLAPSTRSCSGCSQRSCSTRCSPSAACCAACSYFRMSPGHRRRLHLGGFV